MRTLLPLLLIATLPAAAWADEANRLAAAHRAGFPRAEWGYHYYLSTAAVPRPQRQDLAQVLAFVVASCSPQPVIERCTPRAVGPDLYHLDLRGLEWRYQDWHQLLEAYPYSPAELPLVVRADWLLVHLTDATASASYYRLLHRGTVPATRDEWLQLWGVSGDPALRFGLIEAASGVSKARTRWIENRPMLRGYAWGTRDVARLAPGRDPLEQPAGDFGHDAEEWILGVPKLSTATGRRGVLQVYLLTDGKGKRVDKADTDVVEDATRFRGLAAVRTPGSCMSCHARGLHHPSVNELRRLIAAGVDTYAGLKTRDALERFHLGDVAKDIERGNEDFAAGVAMASGQTPDENAEALRAAVAAYDRPVDLAAAALELDSTPAELRLALASASDGHLGARLAGLAHEQPIPRTAWEDLYLIAREALEAWRANHVHVGSDP